MHAKRVISTRITSLHGSHTSPVLFFMQNNVISIRITWSQWVPALIWWFCMQNSDFWITITSLYESQTSPIDLWMQKSVLRSRMTLVYWSQPLSVVLCIQNNDFKIRISSLYGSQPSSVVFACKTPTLGPELQVSTDPRLHLWFLHSKRGL